MRFVPFPVVFCMFIFPTDFVSIASAMTQADSIKKAGQHLSFGVRYLKSKQYEDAETQFLKSFGFNPKRARTARELGKLYEEIEEYEDAIQWFQKAVELDPKSKYTKIAHIALARIYIIQEQPEKAIGSYEALLEFNLESEEKIKYYHALVSLNVETKEYEKALEYAKKWGELAPDEPEVRDMIGKLRRETGGNAEPLSEMEKILDMNSDDYIQLSEELEREAILQQRKGNHRLSFEYYEKLYNADTSNVFFLEKTIELGEYIGKPKDWLISRLEKLHYMRPDNTTITNQLSILTQDTKWSEKPGNSSGKRLSNRDIFGLKKGMSLEQVRALGFGKLVHHKDDTYYVLNPNKPKDFYIASFIIDDHDGLLKASFMMKVSTNKYGDELKRKYRELRDILKKKYGRNKYGGEEYDYLKAGSIWNRPEDFVMGLAKHERILAWSLSNMFPYNRWWIDTVGIRCEAENIYSDATISIYYEFNGFKEYARFKKDNEASQF